MKDYKIVIPTYKRKEILKEKTLKYCLDCGIKSDKIFIFVANEEEYKDYKDLEKDGFNLIIGVKGIKEQRQFIVDYFDDNDFIVSMDDDIEYLTRLENGKLVRFDNLETLIKNAFRICLINKTKLWGISAVNNPFYMKDDITTSLKFIVGCFYGFINDKDDFLKVSKEIKVKEDYEKTIKSFIKFGKVVRLNGFSPKTKYYTEKGGLQGERSIQDSEEAALYLLNKYPDYVSLKGFGSNGHMEIKLKSKK